MIPFQNSIDKLKKGCRKELVFTHGNGKTHWKCGQTKDYDWMYCESCQSQLTQLQNLSKQVQDILDEMENGIVHGTTDWDTGFDTAIREIRKQLGEI